jgi:tetratricopeptide (TPR) repeat protein
MIEIAETYLDAEDYDGAIKFYGRLLRIEDMEINDRGEVLFKHALSHYRRARENLKKEERLRRDSEKSIIRPDLKTEELPKADFANVKLDLRDYSKNFPSSQYVPEAHYVLALTYDQLNERKMAIVELLKLLKGSPFRPEVINAEIQSKPEHERDYKQIARMRGLWIFWKKKTGNYLANKFFEEGDFHSALRVYEAMREIDQTADWRVPVLYQIALCQEKLGLYVQAVETYSEVRDEVQMGSADTAARVEGNKYLKYVYGMAKWRREQLEETRSIRQAANRYGIRTGASLSNPDGS